MARLARLDPPSFRTAHDPKGGVHLQCAVHPTYQAKREPRVECLACEALYLFTQNAKVNTRATD